MLDDRSPSKFGDTTSPLELMILLRHAELAAYHTSQHKKIAVSNEWEYQRILLAQTPSRGVIIVDLESPTPQAYGGDYTVIDLPGLTNHGYDSKIQYYRSLARHYILQQTIVAVVVHISGMWNLSIPGSSFAHMLRFCDIESEHESFSLKYARTLAEDTRITSMRYSLRADTLDSDPPMLQ